WSQGTLTLAGTTVYDNVLAASAAGSAGEQLATHGSLVLANTIVGGGSHRVDCAATGAISASHTLVEDATCLPPGSLAEDGGTNQIGDAMLAPLRGPGA